ncbi:MAG: glucose-6-phosphate isomerase [Alphaproteobacteria bacterium]|nr:MAG: glucose-6-phosphate isomerase [Alphaproteobacteria bacterium]
MNQAQATKNTPVQHMNPIQSSIVEPQGTVHHTPQDAALASRALTALRSLYEQPLALFSIVDSEEDLAEIETLAQRITAQSDVLVLVGIGGSSLGAEALVALRSANHSVRLMVMDNPDPESFAQMQQTVHPDRTSWLFISKSGGTLETITQVMLVLDWLEHEIGAEGIRARCYACTEPTSSSLAKLADHYGMMRITHDPLLGGRWSCAANIGLVPAAVCGVDVRSVRRGMRDVLHHALHTEAEHNVAIQGALYAMRHAALGRTIHTIMPYVDRLEFLSAWCRQLISESLGKDGKGITPLAALGTVDQHSMLQLMLDGMDQQFFTVITTHQHGVGTKISKKLADVAGLSYLADKPLGDVMDAFQQGTIASLQAAGRPVRTMHVPVVDAYHLGALLMHIMIETILIADMMEVNAFDQPAVEDSKIRAKKVLGA